MGIITAVFVIVLVGIVCDTIAKIATGGSRAKAFKTLQAEIDELRAALAEAEGALNGQATQIEEMQQRLDFAERLLAQARQKPAIGAGPHH